MGTAKTFLWVAVLGAVAAISPPARAHAVGAEVTSGNGFLGLNLTGDLELAEDQTFLTLGYSAARPSRYSVFSHLFALGVDHAFTDRLLFSGMLSASPPATTPVQLGPDLTYRAITTNLGATASLAYASGGFDFFEYGVDVSLGVVGHRLGRELTSRVGTVRRNSNVVVFKPQLGVVALLDVDTELSFRGGYWVYSQDPAEAGRLSEEELNALVAAATARAERLRFTDEQTQAALSILGGRLGDADAVSGLPSAPLWFELRFTAAHRFGGKVRGQVGYTFDRYVPGEGYAHLASTRWSFQVAEAWRLWGALALQVDVLPPDESGQPRPPAPSGLLTAGAEYTF